MTYSCEFVLLIDGFEIRIPAQYLGPQPEGDRGDDMEAKARRAGYNLAERLGGDFLYTEALKK
jgi:hypothetical protein